MKIGPAVQDSRRIKAEVINRAANTFDTDKLASDIAAMEREL
jgi:hypothetical protein